MAQARKDLRGRALRKGEVQRASDKRYMYTYTDPLGRRKYIYANDLTTLREKEKKLMKDQLDGLDLYVAGKATINDTFDRYMSTKYDLRSTTRSNYLYVWDHFIRDTFGKKLIADIKYSDVLQFYLYLLNDTGITLGTLDSVHGLLHPTFQLALRDNVIRSNPTDGVMAELKRKMTDPEDIRHALTIEQQREFLDFLERPEYVRWKPLFTVMFGTGCRVGEVIGLRWTDIDLKNESISINHNVTYYPRSDKGYRCEFRVSLPKTEAGIRMIPMLDKVKDAFILEKKNQKEKGYHSIVELDGMSGFIFCNRFGNLHNPASINREIKRIVDDHNAYEEIKARPRYIVDEIVSNK